MMDNSKVQLVLKHVSQSKGKRNRLTNEKGESMKKRRADVLKEVCA